MRNLIVEIELDGKSVYVGNIIGNDYQDACFKYSKEYLVFEKARPISISLPLKEEPFNSDATKNFFEGLLPEGFMRRSVAKWMRTDENDYLSILARLGSECLGAIKIVEKDGLKPAPHYIKLTDEEVKSLASEGTTESVQLVTKAHLSLTGASGKVGLYYYDSKNEWYLPVGEAPSTHIVKQSHIRLKKIVANEQLCLLTAKKLGIDIPESFIVNLGGLNDEEVLFATRRYDRKFEDSNNALDGLVVPFRLHQEDFAQALGISAAQKYEKELAGYMKKMFDIIRQYSSNPIADQIKMWDICIFNYLVGNTDNHIKNFSLVYSEDLRNIRLAPAYDIISTMIYESSTEEMAMSIGGIYNINEIDKSAFERQARNVGLGSNMAMKRFNDLVSNFKVALDNSKNELVEQGYYDVGEIYNKILSNGGIKNYL